VGNTRGRASAFVLLLILMAPAVLAVEISGTVFEQGTGTPLDGAIVTLQATEFRVETWLDGSYILDVPAGRNLVIVAARKGYFNQSILVDAPVTDADIELQPVLQEDDPDYDLVPPEDCAACHIDAFDQWSGSPMANAGLNTWVLDIYSGDGTPGGMGGFVYLRDSIYADTNPASECAACHQPEAWIETPFSALINLEDPVPDTVLHGISCESCHKVADVDVSNIDYPGLFPGAATFTRPSNIFENQVQYGVLGDSAFHSFGLMRPSYQPQLVAELCGLCHQDKNDIEQDHEFDDITSEPTYTEWIEAPYGDPGSPLYTTCVDCHMPNTGATTICTFEPIERDPATIHSHEILGTTPEFLENAVELHVTTHVTGNQLTVNAEVDNSLTGHHVPTGVTVRNMILLVEAWRDGDDPLSQSLVHTGSQLVHDLGGIGDPAQGYYAGLPGKFFAKVNHDARGNGPTFFTDATGIQFDNRIPALQVDASQYTFELPPENVQVNVRARLIYRRAFRFLVDAKQWTQDGHGNPLEDVLAPHYGHLMEQVEGVVLVGADTGACCHDDGSCTEESGAGSCDGEFFGPGTTCGPTTCETGPPDPPDVPAGSTWSLLILTLALLALGVGRLYRS
jgi:hypothetical protein